MAEQEWKEYGGGCHCGSVRYTFRCKGDPEIVRCNCSICVKKGFLHVLIPKEDFHLLTAEDQVTSYQFGTMAARHTFCKTCGIHSYYHPRSHPNGISVNAYCVDTPPLPNIDNIIPFDGKNWDKSIDVLLEGEKERKEQKQ